MNLFGNEPQKNIKKVAKNAPLADRMRPEKLKDIVGQDEIIGPGKILCAAIERDEVPSMIFWGPPGCGKTSLARVIARTTKSVFVNFSAASGNIKEVREIIRLGEERQKREGVRTILFVDEIHRFNKAQQDAFLPYVENGTIILIGATTENPSFEVNSALLSRCRVFVLKALEPEVVEFLIKQALTNKERGFGGLKIKINEETIKFLANMSDGDARVAFNALELAVRAVSPDEDGTIEINEEKIKQSLQKSHLLYDRAGEEHYNAISALHKSMRGGDADGALYWLGRMLESGEDPLYVARRLIRFASEDVGLADPNALVQAVAAYEAAHFNGMPECGVNLAQAAAYLARAPKNNKLYMAYEKVKADIRNFPNEGVPLHLRNAPTKLMKDLDYGKGYKYNPEYEEPVEQEYLPENLKGRKYLDLA